MIRLRRPADIAVLNASTRAYLDRKSTAASAFPPHDPGITTAWAAFLATAARRDVEQALNAVTHGKCAYCENIAAKDIEHFHPKSIYPNRMFAWNNFLRGCKNCNNVKQSQFPLDGVGGRLLIDPCEDEPLEYFTWDMMTGAAGLTPDPSRNPRAMATHELFSLDQEPLREERRNKALDVLYLLARVVEESPVRKQTQDRLRDHLSPNRPWLGIIRQLFKQPPPEFKLLVEAATTKLPDILNWSGEWL
ncbi:retron system putative HNH endonuclease [Aquisphaera insulae]|uniref:retron system putative HNH endonuclease n=1 Tax=Aquisphaera insulae TaxID=2712864 RepID=UPI0013ED0B56|nr:retron system putative HNH endonuclease [Aquisphaera insulae]